MFLAVLAFDLAFDLFYALLLKWLFSVIGIHFLATLSYWQCFGLLVAWGVFAASSRMMIGKTTD